MTKNIKAILLGSIKKNGDREKELDLSLLKEPFEIKSSVIYSLCRNCGGILELTNESAQKLVRLAGIEKTESFAGHYFLTRGCPFCGNDFESAEIKKLA